MPRSPSRLSVPHARLTGQWDVLRTTDDGRTTIALREDGESGVAIGYPYAEWSSDGDEALKVAAVRNADQGYVLVSASFASRDAIDAVTDSTVDRRTIDLADYNALSNREVMRLLDGGTLVLVDVGQEQWFPGAIQLFEDVTRARETWLESFPRVRERFTAVERLLSGVGLEQVIRRRPRPQ